MCRASRGGGGEWRRAVILLILLTFVPDMGADARETIRVSAGMWPPFTGERLSYHGVAARIVSEALSLEGVDVEYRFQPWKRAYVSAKTGQVHGSILWRYVPEREHDFYYCDPVIKVDVVFFHLKGFEFKWKTLDDLTGIRIGVVRGFNYSDDYTRGVASGKLLVHETNTQEQNFKKLMAGRIQVTPVVRASGYATLEKLFPPSQAVRVTHHPVPLATQELHLILTRIKPENERISRLFNRGLKKLRNNGRFDNLRKVP